MNKKERAAAVLRLMDEKYGTDLKCYLHYETPWQLLFSTILSAQCTDARVNAVTPELYRKYPDVQAFAAADIDELEKDIHSIGFYHTKARNLIACARMLLTEFGGEVPRTVEELTSLPGVGRKTANVIRGNVYGDPSVVVDTHVGRVSRRLGLTEEQEPEKVEQDLMKVLPKDHWILWNLQAIALGREICKAPTPRCEECFVRQYCRSGNAGKAGTK
ncbi:MAG: endonuclease III [Lachnospiraceae bacterium]|jgi:endonuclease-3|nr:endonuclease III [Lachnospiraceae bacterium]